MERVRRERAERREGKVIEDIEGKRVEIITREGQPPSALVPRSQLPSSVARTSANIAPVHHG